MPYLDYPGLVLDRPASTHGHCNNCNLYAATFSGLCRDCYEEHYGPVWEEIQRITREHVRSERIKLINSQELKQRRKKGLAVINMRR
jgi:hypothetical protein